MNYEKLLQKYSRTKSVDLLKIIQDKHRELCYAWDQYRRSK